MQAALLLSLLTSVLAAGNVVWLIPWSSVHQEQVLEDAKANPSLAALMEGQFKMSSDRNMVLYLGSVKGNQFQDVFLAQLRQHKTNAHLLWWRIKVIPKSYQTVTKSWYLARVRGMKVRRYYAIFVLLILPITKR